MASRVRPAPGEQPRRRGAPVVDQVLAVVLEELAQAGYQRLSVPAVAERAGLNKTSVYRRWPTKAALVAAALAKALAHDAEPPDTGALRSDMLALTLAAAEWSASHAGRAVLRTMQAEIDDGDLRSIVTSLLRRRASAPMVLFRRARARGEIGPGADVRMALTVIAGTLSHRILVEQARDKEALRNSLTPVAAADFEHLVPGHGAMVPRDGKRRLLEALHERGLLA